MSSASDGGEVLARLAAKDEIRDLAAAYAIAVDDHDLDTLLATFATGATFTVAGETLSGHAAIREFYIGSMERYHTMLHTPEIHLITVEDATHASGVMSGHAELAVHDTLMITAFRYQDHYVAEQGRWLFRSRSVRFMYAVPFEAMGASFRSTKRIRWPQTRYTDADYPESAPTWRSYRHGS